MTDVQRLALKVSAGLWIIWGLVHAIAGILVLSADASGGFAAIADAVEPSALAADYHGAVGGILNQHAWNLLWFGVCTTVGAVFIWRGNLTSIWVTGLIGGLADLGYLLFVDFPGYVNFMPGTLMTIVSGSAVVLSFWVWLSPRRLTDG